MTRLRKITRLDYIAITMAMIGTLWNITNIFSMFDDSSPPRIANTLYDDAPTSSTTTSSIGRSRRKKNYGSRILNNTSFILHPEDIWMGGDTTHSENGLTRFLSEEDQRHMESFDQEKMIKILRLFEKQGDTVEEYKYMSNLIHPCNINIWEGLLQLSDLGRKDVYSRNDTSLALCKNCNPNRVVRRYLKSTNGCNPLNCSQDQADILRDQFFDQLNSRNVSYVVLRWWETLPSVDFEEDIDILFDEKDEVKFANLLTNKRPILNSPKFDVYSDTGLRGSSYKGKIPYYQTNIARKILDSRVLYKRRYYVPSPKDYVMSLIYHIVFHKGSKSGLSYGTTTVTSSPPPFQQGDHAYAAILSDLATKAGMNSVVSLGNNITLNNLHEILSIEGWAPSIDMARKLTEEAGNDPFLDHVYPMQDETIIKSAKRNGTLHTFVVREWGYEHGLLPPILALLEVANLGVSHVITIPEEKRIEVSKRIRGGKWDEGPYRMSGGIPAAILVVWDPFPKIPSSGSSSAASGKKYIMNTKVVAFKESIRLVINSLLIPELQLNLMHSSDDDLEFWDYLQVSTTKDQYKQIEQDVLQMRHEWYNLPEGATDYRDADAPTTGRSRVRLIDWDDGTGGEPRRAIYKVFLSSASRFLEREVYAYSTLAATAPPGSIPKLLARGKHWLIAEAFDFDSDPKQQQALWRDDNARQQLANWIRWFTMSATGGVGWAHGDFQARHAVVQKNGKVGILDFELLQQYHPDFPFSTDGSTLDYEEHFDLAGDYPKPQGVCWDYAKMTDIIGPKRRRDDWKIQLGMPLQQLLAKYLPPDVLRVK